ncbi:hypothetical protein C9374_002018 [Naegleria lovaniensis]|uniref:N-acetyltransferase domain-containing protein n=1 Tax=Naegleria lovaniensis TaxID=51637 RepID=A0AA88GW99_NAELO|nr:uncharacterized protein C9374_002018 [Naegleria lovaniensis]KAG2386983.1 hypothetical protein C9374_002018 [Naegleria lovaniensis]
MGQSKRYEIHFAKWNDSGTSFRTAWERNFNARQYQVQYWPMKLLVDTSVNSEQGDDEREIIGCCGLRPYDLDHHIYEMGIHLKEKYWGKGYAQEACLGVMEYAFNNTINLNVSSLFAGHHPDNTSSAHLLKKLGFQFTHNEYYAPTGLLHPSYLMKKDEYFKQQEVHRHD